MPAARLAILRLAFGSARILPAPLLPSSPSPLHPCTPARRGFLSFPVSA